MKQHRLHQLPHLQYLRPMQHKDLAEVMVGELASYSYPWTQGNFEDCINNQAYSCWVFQQGSQLNGHLVISAAVKEAHILNICVYPELQGKGWGRKLLSEAEIIAEKRQAETVFLEVRPSNKAGINLYQSEGYNEIGLRKGYYPADNGREDALVMAKTLVFKSL